MSDAIESHLIEKFEIVERLGKGAYGIVWKAVKRADDKVVALKKVFDAFHNKTDAQRYTNFIFSYWRLPKPDMAINFPIERSVRS